MAVTRKDLEPGLYCDRDGLYLRVAQGGSRGWVFRFMLTVEPAQ
jgi:hypothetical protein